MAGKGDTRRPQQISEREMEDRWEQIFGGSGRRVHAHRALTDEEREEARRIARVAGVDPDTLRTRASGR